MAPDAFYLNLIVWLGLLFIFFQIYKIVRLNKTMKKKRSAPSITISNSKVFFDSESNLKSAVDDTQVDTAGFAETAKPGQEILANGKTERRQSQRRTLKTIVDFVIQGKLFKEPSKDLSDTGMFIVAKKPVRYHTNEPVTLTFQIPEGDHYKHRGRIVRKTNRGIGVLFSAA